MAGQRIEQCQWIKARTRQTIDPQKRYEQLKAIQEKVRPQAPFNRSVK
jgi:hypothetical protein